MANPQPDLPRDPDPPQNPAAVDAAHGSTGWNAYEVWRNRVFTPAPETDVKTRKER
jgi:hypothetical protein